MSDGDEAQRRADERLDSRLNQVATTLIGATAGVTALFTLLGATSERIWVLLDDATNKRLLIATMACAVLAITFGLRALTSRSPTRTAWWLTSGAVAFVLSLSLAIATASSGANIYARPAFREVAVERPSPEAVIVRFTVRVAGLDRNQRIAVRVIDQTTGQHLLDTSLAPDEAGTAEQKVQLPIGNAHTPLLLEAWHRDRSTAGSPEPTCEQEDRPAGSVSPPASRLAPLPDGTVCLTLLP